jgi:hypothetical protein
MDFEGNPSSMWKNYADKFPSNRKTKERNANLLQNENQEFVHNAEKGKKRQKKTKSNRQQALLFY